MEMRKNIQTLKEEFAEKSKTMKEENLHEMQQLCVFLTNCGNKFDFLRFKKEKLTANLLQLADQVECARKSIQVLQMDAIQAVRTQTEMFKSTITVEKYNI